MKMLLVALLMGASVAQARSMNYVCQTATQKESVVLVAKQVGNNTQFVITKDSAGKTQQFYSVLDAFQQDEFNRWNNTTSVVKSAQSRRSADVILNSGMIFIQPMSNTMMGNQPKAKVTLSINGQVTEYTCQNRF